MDWRHKKPIFSPPYPIFQTKYTGMIPTIQILYINDFFRLQKIIYYVIFGYTEHITQPIVWGISGKKKAQKVAKNLIFGDFLKNCTQSVEPLFFHGFLLFSA